jgi:hypothetical protein
MEIGRFEPPDQQAWQLSAHTLDCVAVSSARRNSIFLLFAFVVACFGGAPRYSASLAKHCPELPEFIGVETSIPCSLAERAVYFLLVQSNQEPIPLTSVNGELFALDLENVKFVASTDSCGALIHVAQPPDAHVEFRICVAPPCANSECELSIRSDAIVTL